LSFISVLCSSFSQTEAARMIKFTDY